MNLEFLQGAGKELIESRAHERNSSFASQVLTWRIEPIDIVNDLRERVIHQALGHIHTKVIGFPVYYGSSQPPAGTISISGVGIKRVAVRVRGVAAKIPTGNKVITEGDAHLNRYGAAFSLRVNQTQIGGHSVRVETDFLPDVGASFPTIALAISPIHGSVLQPPATIGLNTYDDVGLSDDASKIDRIVYFSVSAPATLTQVAHQGWLRFIHADGGFYIGGSDAPLIPQIGASLGVSIGSNRWVSRNETGLNIESLQQPHAPMFSNPTNRVGLDVKLLGFYSDSQFRAVEYREF